MEPNVKVYRMHRTLAFLYGALGVISGMGVLAEAGVNPAAFGALTGVMGFFGAIAAMHYFTGRACLQRKSGGRTMSQVIACVMLLGIPVGTAIGVYLLINSRGWRKPGDEAPREAVLDF